jgi:hypothetical protein
VVFDISCQKLGAIFIFEKYFVAVPAASRSIATQKEAALSGERAALQKMLL